MRRDSAIDDLMQRPPRAFRQVHPQPPSPVPVDASLSSLRPPHDLSHCRGGGGTRSLRGRCSPGSRDERARRERWWRRPSSSPAIELGPNSPSGGAQQRAEVGFGGHLLEESRRQGLEEPGGAGAPGEGGGGGWVQIGRWRDPVFPGDSRRGGEGRQTMGPHVGASFF